ncbi:hypothetical protein KJB35_02015 [Vibrio sp. D431a]|nr:hypothetical protein [Vibrio sp. D431a]
MSAGKLSAQTGHAFEAAMTRTAVSDPHRHNLYRDSNGGSKVALEAKNSNALLRAYNQALSENLPCHLVVDQGHVIPDSRFDGSPIITALSIGPVNKAESKHITKKFNCIK